MAMEAIWAMSSAVRQRFSTTKLTFVLIKKTKADPALALGQSSYHRHHPPHLQ
jgi:hypothetical protein